MQPGACTPPALPPARRRPRAPLKAGRGRGGGLKRSTGRPRLRQHRVRGRVRVQSKQLARKFPLLAGPAALLRNSRARRPREVHRGTSSACASHCAGDSRRATAVPEIAVGPGRNAAARVLRVLAEPRIARATRRLGMRPEACQLPVRDGCLAEHFGSDAQDLTGRPRPPPGIPQPGNCAPRSRGEKDWSGKPLGRRSCHVRVMRWNEHRWQRLGADTALYFRSFAMPMNLRAQPRSDGAAALAADASRRTASPHQSVLHKVEGLRVSFVKRAGHGPGKSRGTG